MFQKIFEIFLCLLITGCTQTLVVLSFPFISIDGFFEPNFIILHGIKRNHITSLCDFDEWGDEFFQESRHFEQTRPKMLNEIYKKSFYVRTIVILIRHNHYRSVTQRLYAIIILAQLETHNLT